MIFSFIGIPKQTSFRNVISINNDLMSKLPPIEKIPEAYSAIADGRVTIQGDQAIVYSSDRTKSYTVNWSDGVYSSNDNALYWQRSEERR